MNTLKYTTATNKYGFDEVAHRLELTREELALLLTHEQAVQKHSTQSGIKEYICCSRMRVSGLHYQTAFHQSASTWTK